jgi:curved DNA-binding protein CbpA
MERKMKISRYYYEILGISPEARMDEIKKAFRRLVKQNHPDLFPEEHKQLQELKMIQINEAYARLTEHLDNITGIEKIKEDNTGSDGFFRSPHKSHDAFFRKDAVGFHRDLQYVYYKQGFTYFSRALHGMKRMEKTVSLRNDMYYLKRFSESLVCLRKADTYFSMLIDEFPDSIWSYDARIKLRRIERFNFIYRKIIRNIEEKLTQEYDRREAVRIDGITVLEQGSLFQD